MSTFSMKTVAVATVIGGMIAGAVSASAALNLPTTNCSYAFNMNMKLGSRGTDVMNLQKVLNAYTQTQVAQSGAGSPGMETSYFGPATRVAVNKLQALHLVELGITAPTGNVFAGTRGILNQLCAGGNAGNNGGNTGNTGGTVQSGPVSVMLSASQPSGMLVAGQAGALIANLTFSGNGTVTSVELQRIGVSADSSLNNVYLYDGNVRITDAASVVTGGYIRFNASNGLFTVNGSRTISVRADIAASTNGQSVGVKLNSVTAMGGSPSSYSNVMGNVLLIGSATPAAVNFSAISANSSVTVDAGTQNYKVWDSTLSVSTRDVNLRSATFKFVGSAPTDAIQNLSLFVDGTKVAGPAMINAANNNKLTFDLGSMPYLLKTGSHTLDVRGDIVKGSNRSFTFSVENAADIMLEDTSLSGVNVSATVGVSNAVLTQSNTAYNSSITINKGSVTVNVDPSFNATKVTGGATNVPVGQFTLKAYGEDVKINTLQVNFNMVTATSVNNVSLYVNGGQVGTSQNYRGSALTYTLGSSLIIPAGQTVTLTVKADMVNASNAAWSTGSIATVIGGVTGNAQGQSSNELINVASSGVTGNTLTMSNGAGTFARTAGFTSVSVSPNTPNVKIGSFTLAADSAEGIRVNSIGVNPYVSGYAITNLSNLTLKTGSQILGSPVGNPTTGTSTFSFNEITIPANGTMTFDVYADIGSTASGSTTPSMDITYRGTVSQTTTSASAVGATITSAVATLADAVRTSTSPTAQNVVGSTPSFTIVTYKLATAAVGTSATVNELQFTTTGTDAITTITVGGVTRAVNGSGTTTIPGLNINVPYVGVDVPVIVAFSGFQGATTPGSLTTGVTPVSITLGTIKSTSGSGSTIQNFTPVSSNNMTLVASKPTVTVSNGGTDVFNIGALSKLGEFTVSADANGKIALASTTFSLSTVGVSQPELSTSTLVLKDAAGLNSITGVNYSTFYSSTSPAISFTTPYEIGAGQSKTFTLWGTITGVAQSGIAPRVNSSLSSSGFKWNDVIGGNVTYTSTGNFPTNSYTSKY